MKLKLTKVGFLGGFTKKNPPGFFWDVISGTTVIIVLVVFVTTGRAYRSHHCLTGVVFQRYVVLSY